MAAGLLGGAEMGLHALVAVRRSLVARVAVSMMVVTFKVSGAVLAGAPGAAAGGALAMWPGAALWWWKFEPIPDVVVRNLVIEKFGSQAQDGAVDSRGSSGWGSPEQHDPSEPWRGGLHGRRQRRCRQ